MGKEENNPFAEQDLQSGFPQLSKDLREATLHKLKLFESIRGKKCNIPFWDVVVITAIDTAQKQAYEQQIEEKLERKELPLDVKFHVIADPIGPKIGNGGSTLVVARELENLYPDVAKNLKTLILHAGGFSQRLPSGSLLGKIFMALPMGKPLYQMLELKLAMYIDYPQRMPPGIFVTSADTIELYALDGDWTFMNPGFTAMAHPSPIEIGTTHGVFVLDDSSLHTRELMAKENKSVQNGKCRKFLHKPTKELMRSSGAVFMHDGEEFVYSDSAYFMDYSTSKLLLDWSNDNGHLDCEIDAYGDFLQALGPEGTIDYCNNVRNVTFVEPNLIKTREKIFQTLRKVQLNVLMLNKSKFYHIGTTSEYIHHFCKDLVYRYEMACSNTAMVKSMPGTEFTPSNNQCLLHTFLEGKNTIGRDTVVEYSYVGKNAKIGSSSIVSNVFIPDGIATPDNAFLHTVCVKSDNGELFVTVAFGVNDNLKKTCSNAQSLSELKLNGKDLSRALELLGYQKNIWSKDCQLLNIWHAHLFPAFQDARQSFKYGCQMLDCLNTDQPITAQYESSPLYSMAEILKEKEINGIFKMRTEIRLAILRN